MSLSLIVAMTPKQIIGRKDTNAIPWKIKEDMDLFRQITTGKTAIMGRNTWESLPQKSRPLPNRDNLVVSKKIKSLLGAHVFPSYDAAVEYSEKLGKEAVVIGGVKLYAEAMQDFRLMNMYISHIKEDYPGDVYFPEFSRMDWNVCEEKLFPEFIFRKYVRRLG